MVIDRVMKDRIAQIGGVLLGILTYLVEPNAAFYALWIAVVLDLISRIIVEAAHAGGYIKATKERKICSDKMFVGSAIKIVAYFFMTVIVYQSKHLVAYEQVPLLLSTVVYGILFWVEFHSITENFVEAGVEELRPLLWRIKREQKRFEDGEEPPASVTGGRDGRGD